MNILARALKKILLLSSFKRVIFSDGSSLMYFNREALLYTEQNGHRMEVVWYFNRWFSRGRLVRFMDIDYWDPPYSAETVPLSKREEILSKIIEYARKKGINLRVEK